MLDQPRGDRKEPYAIQTPLGWTLMGPTGSESSQEFQVNFVESQDNSLQRQFERMMQMDFSESSDYMAKEMSRLRWCSGQTIRLSPLRFRVRSPVRFILMWTRTQS